jgi:hypothetical protein
MSEQDKSDASVQPSTTHAPGHKTPSGQDTVEGRGYPVQQSES